MKNSVHIPTLQKCDCTATTDELRPHKPEFLCSFVGEARGSQALVDVIKYGYIKSLRIMSNVIKFAQNLMHQLHRARGMESSNKCLKCFAKSISGDSAIEMDKLYVSEAKNYYFRLESKRLKSVLPKKKLDSLMFKDGIYYQVGRLSEEIPVTFKDLDFNIFLDSSSIKAVLPVVLSDSDLFFAYVIHIHHNVRIHAGVEITMKEVLSTMFVPNYPRRIIQEVRKKCSKCRLIAKKTLELAMAQHPSERVQIAPPFYNVMADTVFGFKGQIYKKARKTTKIYALILVCLLTSAVNILACEGLETQDVIQALERHSARHGTPCTLFVDKGTQLVALENVNFSLRDLDAQVHDSMGMRVVVSTAKSHQERGRVERKVRTLREMLEKLSIKDDTCMTALQWETLFSKLASDINDLPMAKCDRSNVTDAGWDLITPNRLMLGRNNNRSLEGSFNLLKGAGAVEILRRNQNLQAFFYQMMLDRLHHLMHKPEKWQKTDKVNVGDICIFIYNENAAMKKDVWRLGEVVNVDNPRKIEIAFPSGLQKEKIPKRKTIVRSPRQICVIFSADAVDLNSKKFLENILVEQ